MQCKTVFEKLPWNRQINGLQKGSIHILTSVSKSPEREQFSLFSSAYTKDIIGLFMKKEKIPKYKIKNIVDISAIPNFSLGVIRGYVYDKSYEKALLNKDFIKHIEETSNNELNIIKADKDRVEGFLGNIILVYHLLKEMKIDSKFSIYPIKIDKISYNYFAFSKNSVSNEFVKLFNEHLNLMIKNGELDKIILKYIPESQIKYISINY